MEGLNGTNQSSSNTAGREFEFPPPVPLPTNKEPPAAFVTSNAPLVLLGGTAGAVVLGMTAIGAASVFQRTRTRRRQLAVIAPNLEQAVAQPLPQVAGAIVAEGEHGTGRSVPVDGESAAVEFGSQPLQIGSAHNCDVRLARAADVAPNHVSVWMRDGKIMLRHTGGSRRPTPLGGRPIDWVLLEPGDESRWVRTGTWLNSNLVASFACAHGTHGRRGSVSASKSSNA